MAEVGKLTRLDYYQLVSSALFFILGLLILYRSLSFEITPLVLMVSLGFVFMGGYRLLKFYLFFRSRRKVNG